MLSNMRSREEISKKAEDIKAYQSSPFYNKTLEVLSWAVDKTDLEIRRRFIDFVRKLKKLPPDSTGENMQVPAIRYEGMVFLWILGNEVPALASPFKHSKGPGNS